MSAPTSPARIARAVEAACAALGVASADAEAAIALAIETVTLRSDHITGLQHKAARLARLVAAARGAVLRHAAMEAALDDTTNETVRVLLCGLRRARPDIGACIETVRGEGLRWRGPPLAALLAGDGARYEIPAASSSPAHPTAGTDRIAAGGDRINHRSAGCAQHPEAGRASGFKGGNPVASAPAGGETPAQFRRGAA